MKKNKWLIIGCLLVLLAIGFLFRKSIVLRITGMKPFVEERFDGWVEAGAVKEELEAALRQIYDPTGSGAGSWVYELSLAAKKHKEIAQKAEKDGDITTTAREYKIASVFYYISRFPFVSTPAKAEAYKQHINCYLKAAKYFDPPLEILRIPFEGKEIIAYLRIPRVDNPPLILVSGGVDSWKSDLDNVINGLVAEGFAVIAIDMPGTGESQWKLKPDSDRIYSYVLEYMKKYPGIDGDRMGVYLVSYSGLFATKLALIDDNIKAAVNVGGPIHLSYATDNIKRLPAVMIATISNAMGENYENMNSEQLAAKASSFSLKKQNLLIEPDSQAALLSINGDQDPLVPIDDLYIISNSGIKQEVWIYKGDGHCAPQNMKTYIPKAANWLMNQINK